ncbi:MAG TPA: DMT family transporter [Candidatus Limnocylindrales bacterium]|nr:DMT family transporter [Candidatus Limnocylindrales bacterium]
MSGDHAARGARRSLILAAASWGLGTVLSKHAVGEFPPATLLAVQLAASLIVLTVVMRARGLPLRDRAAPAALGRLGLLNPGLAYALSLLGLTSITASLSVLLWTVEPILILVLAGLVLGERIGPSLVVLSGLALGGVALLVYEPGEGAVVGVALTIAGIACCAVYTVLGRRWLGTVDATAPVVVAQQAWALVLAAGLVGVVGLLGGPVVPATMSIEGGLSAVASGVLYYGAAYWFYLSALRRMPASSAAASFYLIPVFGVAGGLVLLGERLALMQWIGAGAVLLAVVLILRRPGEPVAQPASTGAVPAVLE